MNVNTSAGGMGVFDKDYISYTVSAPSGRGTAMLSVDGKWHPLPTFLILIFISGLLQGDNLVTNCFLINFSLCDTMHSPNGWFSLPLF